jgi:hypothetical protein
MANDAQAGPYWTGRRNYGCWPIAGHWDNSQHAVATGAAALPLVGAMLKHGSNDGCFAPRRNSENGEQPIITWHRQLVGRKGGVLQ